ncbi:MAG: uracil-DNA glycosylase [Bordetella sp.]|nr:MAG: uracil-DNA glycosylase [Bordetella sp.]
MSNYLLPNTLISQLSNVPNDWKKIIFNEKSKIALKKISEYVEFRLKNEALIYPKNPFFALQNINSPSDIKVVILGQDPYYKFGQAQGLAFSVPNHCKCPPSLKNIFIELKNEYPKQCENFKNDLCFWAKQGVLLLNTILTVEDSKPTSHSRIGWEEFTDEIIKNISLDMSPKVFLLWGRYAYTKKASLLINKKHLILIANHPSPLSCNRPPYPFFGCNHFIKANNWLYKYGRNPINWISSN